MFYYLFLVRGPPIFTEKLSTCVPACTKAAYHFQVHSIGLTQPLANSPPSKYAVVTLELHLYIPLFLRLSLQTDCQLFGRAALKSFFQQDSFLSFCLKELPGCHIPFLVCEQCTLIPVLCYLQATPSYNPIQLVIEFHLYTGLFFCPPPPELHFSDD